MTKGPSQIGPAIRHWDAQRCERWHVGVAMRAMSVVVGGRRAGRNGEGGSVHPRLSADLLQPGPAGTGVEREEQVLRRKIAVRRAIAGLAAIAGIGFLMPSPPVGANGTEQLGPPDIAIASGTGVVSEGTGMFVQPSTVNLTVPANATVKQVLLYWQGEDTGAGDSTITVNGTTEVGGTLIGGPSLFYSNVQATSYRADITGLGIIHPGANSVALSGLNFNVANNGASIVVIYDDQSGFQTIAVRDGVDNAYIGFDGDLKVTEPQTFPVTAAAFDRQAQVDLLVGSVDDARGSVVRITSGGQVVGEYFNLLGDTDDEEWDDVDLEFTIPANANSVTVEVISQDVDGKFAASLEWVAAILSAPGAGGNCTPTVPNVQASTKGSAFAVDARILGGLIRIDKAGKVYSALPEGPAHDSDKPLPVSILGLVNAKILATGSNSNLGPSTTTSGATVADVSLLGGLVRAGAVKAVSQSNASQHGSGYNSKGSTIVGLTVGGAAVNVAPNVKVAVKLLGISIAELYVMEEKGTSSFADGVSKASHSMNALRLVLLKSYLGIPAGTTVTLSHAESSAQSPISGCPEAKSVSGKAFTAFVDGNLAGKNFLDVQVGDAELPPTGGADADGVVVQVPGVVTSATAANTTSGSLTPNPHATSRSIVEGANVLNGLVTAKVLDVQASSSANGTTAGTTFKTRFVDLRVGGKVIVVDGDVAPNSHIVVDLGSLGYVLVILNEQSVHTTGGTDTAGTVNAVHVYAYTLHGLFTGEVILASAHSDAHA